MAGSSPVGPGYKSTWMLDVEEAKLYETSAIQDHGAARGGFDKHGDAWFGGRGFVRFNPKTDRWIVYENPEPSSLNRYQWIDNTTSPPTIWYADFQTQMFVRIQPLE